jgi:hypothetical protein
VAPDETSRPPEDQAEDQSTNEIGFRDVDEDEDHDEAAGAQPESEGAGAPETDRCAARPSPWRSSGPG